MELEPILEIFWENLAEDLNLMKNHLQNNDLDSLKKMIHKCKGSSGTYGFSDLCDYFIEFETMIETNDSKMFVYQFEKIDYYMKNLEIVFVSVS
jgi:HPt (histidine-containing phosphotransfer) domain-containing protein